MDTLWPPIFLFSFALIVGVLFIYGMAYIRARRFDRDVEEYRFLTSEFEKLNRKMYEEADQWPIFARPVLFTEYDHDAQMRFAEAYKAMWEGREFYLQEEIETIRFRRGVNLIQLLDISGNYHVIAQSTFVKGQKRGLSSKIAEVSELIKLIQSKHYNVEKLRRATRNGLADFKQAIDASEPTVKEIQKWDLNSGSIVGWAITIANNAYEYAIECFKKRTDDEHEYREYAVAKVCIMLGYAALDYIRIFANQYKIPDRFELDFFKDLFATLKTHLDTSLEKSLDGWKKLRLTKEHLDEFPELKRQAEASLDEFKILREEFEILENQYCELDFEVEIKNAGDVERKCLRYFYPYQERDTEWRKWIGNHALPSTALTQLQDEKISFIDPLIGFGIVIKQSMLPEIKGKLDAALFRVKAIRTDVATLDREFHRQQKAENEVNELIGQGGRTQILVEEIRRILSADKVPEVLEIGNQCIERFNGIEARANQVRGIDFSILLTDILMLGTECEDTLQLYDEMLRNAETNFAQWRSKVTESLREIELLQNITPLFEQVVLERLDRFGQNARSMISQNVERRYETLSHFSGEMKVWHGNYHLFSEQLNKRIKEFSQLVLAIKQQIDEVIAKVEEENRRAEKKRGWVQDEMYSAIRSSENALSSIKEEWLMKIRNKWGGISFQQAIGECEEFSSRTRKVQLDLRSSLDGIRSSEKIFDKSIDDIRQTATENQENISENDKAILDKLITVARRAPTRHLSDQAVQQAYSFANEHISPRMRDVANVTINTFHQNFQDHSKFVGHNDYSQNGINAEQLNMILNTIFSQIDRRPGLTARDKGDLKAEIQEVKQELAKQENADENFILRRLRNIRRMAPDILEITLAMITNPAVGFGLIAAKIAAKIRQEALT